MILFKKYVEGKLSHERIENTHEHKEKTSFLGCGTWSKGSVFSLPRSSWKEGTASSLLGRLASDALLWFQTSLRHFGIKPKNKN